MSILKFNYNKTLIYVTIYWIVEIAFRLARKLNKRYFDIVDDNVLYEYILVIYSILGDLLSGFFVLYIRCSSKSQKEKEKEKIKEEENKENKENEAEYELIYEEIRPVTKKYYSKYLIIIAVLEYFCHSDYWIAYVITGLKNNEEVSHSLRRDLMNTLDIIIRYIFSIFILKIKIYKHHKISIITISIGCLFITIADITILYFYNVNIGNILYFTSILLIGVIASPFEHILIKKLFQENFIFPEKLQFVRGLINSIIVTILSIILYFSLSIELNLKLKFEYIIAAISYIIAYFIREFLLLKVIYYMSAQSVSFLIISKSMGNSIYEIIDAIRKDKDTENDDIIFYVFEILGFLIILFATFVYEEIIIINKCNLDFYTNKRIIERSEIEKEYSKNLDEISSVTQKECITEILPDSVE